MKVYVCSTGCYSDYNINAIFANKEKAEEYNKWLDDHNDIEEFELADNIEYTKGWNMIAQIKFTLERIVDANIKIKEYSISENNIHKQNYNYYIDYEQYGHNGGYRLQIQRYIPIEHIDKDWYINRYKKVLYDMVAQIKSYIIDGYTEKEINQLLYNYKEESGDE